MKLLRVWFLNPSSFISLPINRFSSPKHSLMNHLSLRICFLGNSTYNMVALRQWLWLESSNRLTGLDMYDGSLKRLTFDAMNQDYQLECLHIVSTCGLGFSQHGSWITSGTIPNISVEETWAYCHFSEHHFFWSSKKWKFKARSVRPPS